MLEGLKLTLTGMLIVFLFLSLLVCLIELMGYLLKSSGTISLSSKDTSQAPFTTSARAAAISAAVATYENEMRK